MAEITFTHEPSLAELRETEAVYTRAMEYLVADGVKEGEARESVCWRRLNRLHQALPDRYGNARSPFIKRSARALPFTSGASARPEGGLVISALNQTMGR